MAGITVESHPYGGYIVENEAGDTRLVQSDWEFPGLARTFGWSLAIASYGIRQRKEEALADEEDREPIPTEPCNCRGTDGTVSCPECGTTATEYITAAAEFLDSCNIIVEDPGYFDSDE